MGRTTGSNIYDYKLIKELHAKLKSNKEVADIVGCSPWLVSRVVRGVPHNNKKCDTPKCTRYVDANLQNFCDGHGGVIAGC